MTAPEYCIDGLIESNALGAIIAEVGAYKTFLVLDTLFTQATGIPFHGRKTKQGPCVYFCGEGLQGVIRRVHALCIRHGLPPEGLPLFISTNPANLLDPDNVSAIVKALELIEAEHGKPVSIAFDTLARNFGAGDENSTRDVSEVIQNLDGIRSRFGCTVLLVHHIGHMDKTRARGSSALHGAFDFEYRLDKDENGIARLTCVKIKDGETPPPIAFKLIPVELGIQDAEGREVSSAVLAETEYTEEKTPPATGKGKWQALALSVLQDELSRRRENLLRAGLDEDNATISIDDWRSACIDAGMPRNRFYDVLKTLQASKVIDVSSGSVSAKMSGSGCPVHPVLYTGVDKPDTPNKPKTGQTGQKPDTKPDNSKDGILPFR